MTQKQLKKLNEIFAEKHGRVPTGAFIGQSIFQFKRAHELRLPYFKENETVEQPSGLFVVEPVFEWKGQFEPGDQRWCIAKWEAPIPETSWTEQFGSKLGWPNNGYWYMFQPLEVGKEPTEEWTRWVADHLEFQRNMSLREHVQRVMEASRKPEEDRKEKIRDIVRDHFVRHVPGKRGGSYLAFNESST